MGARRGRAHARTDSGRGAACAMHPCTMHACAWLPCPHRGAAGRGPPASRQHQQRRRRRGCRRRNGATRRASWRLHCRGRVSVLSRHTRAPATTTDARCCRLRHDRHVRTRKPRSPASAIRRSGGAPRAAGGCQTAQPTAQICAWHAVRRRGAGGGIGRHTAALPLGVGARLL
eukprot:97858-Chlamydomonas_euryale.AAC.6